MRFVSLATWKTSTESSACSWRVRNDRAQNVPAVTPPTLEKEKSTNISIEKPLNVILMVHVDYSVKVLLIMDHCGAVLCGGLFFHQVEELEGVTNGTVWIWPAGGAVVFHLQNEVVLSRWGEKRADVCHNKSVSFQPFVLWTLRTKEMLLKYYFEKSYICLCFAIPNNLVNNNNLILYDIKWLQKVFRPLYFLETLFVVDLVCPSIYTQ